MRKILLRIVLLQESAVDQYHERIAVWGYKVVCSIRVTDSTTNSHSHLG